MVPVLKCDPMVSLKRIVLKWEDYWFKVLGRWRSCSLTCPIDRPHHRHVFSVGLGVF